MNKPLASTAWLLATMLVLVVTLAPFDPYLSERAKDLPEEIVAFNRIITDVGSAAWMIYTAALLLVVAFVVRRTAGRDAIRRKARTAGSLGAYFLLTVGTASTLVHTFKFLIGRARPELFPDYGAYSLTPFTGDSLFESFPSGHSTAAGALFGAFAMLMPRLRPLFLVLALMIGVSRVIVGAHYPSDVAAGLLLGLGTALTFALLFAWRNRLFRFDEAGWPTPKIAGPSQRSQ